MELVTKTIKTPEVSISDRLTLAVNRYYQKWYLKPEGLLVGPNEWMELRLWAEESHRIIDFKFTTTPMFNGLPVYRMTRLGIDVIPGEEIVPHLTIGTIDDSKSST